MLIFKKRYIKSLGRENRHTPDMSVVEDSSHKLVFLCDDVQSGYMCHYKIETYAKEVCRGFTAKPFDYRVGKYGGKAVPFIANDGLKVKGRVYAIESRAIPILDNHYRNGVEFARIKMPILITDRDHRLMNIGEEQFLRNLPPGMIRTIPELGIRHYTSDRQVGAVEMVMYVAMRAHWDYEDFTCLPRAIPTFPRDNIIWLPKYYRYPAERNRAGSARKE